jgi:hypothetical protein
MACNKDSDSDDDDDDDDDDDQYSLQKTTHQMPPPHPNQLIEFYQHGSSHGGGPTQVRYTSHCFI